MTNFEFIKAEWPTIFNDSARAESYVFSDPRSACIYSRRSIERLVIHLYTILDLPTPYKDDLSARINDPKFKAATGIGIHQKLTFLRKLGNNAVHNDIPVPVDAAIRALSELYLVIIWAAFHHSRIPDSVPAGTQFDPKIAKRAAPLSPAELAKLVDKFKQQDEELAAAKKQLAKISADVDAQIAAATADKDSQIKELQRQVAAAQSSKVTTLDSQEWKEDRTRTDLIDVDLELAGWNLDEPNVREFRIAGLPTPPVSAMPTMFCGAPTGSPWPSSKPSAPRRVWKPDGAKQRCTPTGSRKPSVVDPSSSSATENGTNFGTMPADTHRERFTGSTLGTNSNSSSSAGPREFASRAARSTATSSIADTSGRSSRRSAGTSTIGNVKLSSSWPPGRERRAQPLHLSIS